MNSQVCLRNILDLRVAEVGRLSANAKNAFNSIVGCIFANLQQKTLFLPHIPKLQQKSGRKNAIFGLMEKLTVSAVRLKNIFIHLFVLFLSKLVSLYDVFKTHGKKMMMKKQQACLCCVSDTLLSRLPHSFLCPPATQSPFTTFLV